MNNETDFSEFDQKDRTILSMALTSLLDDLENDIMDYPGSKSGKFEKLFVMLDLQMEAATLLVRIMKSLGVTQERINVMLDNMTDGTDNDE